MTFLIIVLYLVGVIIGFVILNCVYRYQPEEGRLFEDSFYVRSNNSPVTGSDIDWWFTVIFTWPFAGLHLCAVVVTHYGWILGLKPAFLTMGRFIQRLVFRKKRLSTKDPQP